MGYTSQVKKSNASTCRTDKSQCRILCPKCLKETGFSKLFKSTENVWRHLHQVHQSDKKEYPSIDYVIEILEKISFSLMEKKDLKEITEAVKLGMILK